jgi:hypothetical protein
MNPAEYLEACRLALIACPVIKTYRIREAYANERRGYFRVRATLTNGDFVEFAEYFNVDSEGINTEDYRFQWMDHARKKLRRRWDNTPHFPDLAGFPHHIHTDNLTAILPGQPMSLASVLVEITHLLSTD